jgi:hypothetical protein
MKECPRCRAKYHDPTLNFCLDDGTPLVASAGDSEATVILGGYTTRENRAGRVSDGVSPVQTGYAAPPSGRKGGGAVWKILIVLVGLGVLVVAVIGAAGVIYFYRSSDNRGEVQTKTTPASPSPTAAPVDDEFGELAEQIAKLEELLNDPEKVKELIEPSLSPPDPA